MQLVRIYLADGLRLEITKGAAAKLAQDLAWMVADLEAEPQVAIIALQGQDTEKIVLRRRDGSKVQP